MTREYDSGVDFEISLGNVELYKTLGFKTENRHKKLKRYILC